jgi:two-component system phosphate regulon sensor histidine kinase PhoR
MIPITTGFFSATIHLCDWLAVGLAPLGTISQGRRASTPGPAMSDHDLLLMALPMPALRIGLDDRIAVLNPAAQALFGIGAMGRHFAIPLRQPEILDAIMQARTAGQTCVARLNLPSTTQDTVLEAYLTPMASGVAVVFQDLSALAQMDQMRRDFVANVSHELRTPLTSLLGFIDTLRGPARDDPAARARFLDIMASEAERMNRLVRDLLQLSRVEAEERVRPERDEDLSDLVLLSVANLRALAESAQVRLQVTGAEVPHVLRSDRDQMLQVLSNLIENAVKYGSSPGDVVLIALTQANGPRGPVLELSVTDQGEGIDSLHIPRLAERFYRVDGHRSREKGGTGLGLAIVKHIVSRHRGRLTIESKLGKGSKFSVLLPLR